MRVPVYERQQSINPLRGGEVSAITPAGDYGAGAAGLAKGLALKIQQMQNDNEDARTLEAFNKFKADSIDYHDNPDKGIYNTRLGGQSEGVFNEADTWLRERGEEYVKGLKSERSKANFRKMARDYIVQKGEQNSRFEAAQMRKYQTEQARAAYQNGLNEIGLNPYDEKFVEFTKQNMTDALELEHRYSSPELRKQALAGLENDVAAARFNTIFNQDPAAADKFYKENKKSFSAESKVRIEHALEGYHVQSAVDKLVLQYPQGSEQEGIKAIREKFSGEREERIVSAYKTRIREIAVEEVDQTKALKQQQEATENTILNNIYVNHKRYSSEALRQAVANGTISYDSAQKIERAQETIFKRANVEKRILEKNPGLTQNELDIAVMREKGITETERKLELAMIISSYLNGSGDDEYAREFEHAYERGLITKQDIDVTKRKLKNIKDVHKAAFSNAETMLKRTLEDLRATHEIINEEDKLPALTAFTEQAATVLSNEYDKDYVKKLEELYKRILSQTIFNATKRDNVSLEPNLYSAFTTPRQKELLDKVLDYKFLEYTNDDPSNKTRDISLNDESYWSDLYDDIGLLSEEEAASLNNEGLGGEFSPVSMVEGGRITSRFSDWRAYRNGQHNGIDVAAPEGTPIKSANFGTVMTVSKVRTGSKTAGNYVILTGVNADGEKIEAQISHMQDNSITIKEGDTVNAGDIIGNVGNTGHSTGAHMDLKIKVDGKYVDPEKWNSGNNTNSGGQGINEAVKNVSPMVEKAAQANGVDADLVKAVIQVESQGNSKAESGKGAQGLMQLMPDTAASLGVTDSLDPEQNINGGVKYLGQLLKQYGGDVQKALWGYNAGPGNVAKGNKPDETKNYIKKVMGIYNKLKGIKTNTQKAAPKPKLTGEMSKEDIFAELDTIFNF